MATLLAKRADAETPVATSDIAHAQLVADPAVPQFTQPLLTSTSVSPAVSISSSPSPFGAPASNSFGSSSPSPFGAPASNSFGSSSPSSFAGTSGFGSPMGGTSGFGGQPGMQGMNGQPGMGMNLTAAAPMNAASDAEVLVKNDEDSEHWINSKWRPAMGWLYMATCAFDFILFPVGWSVLQALSKGSVTSQWQPVTLQGAGLYHIAMGAVLGIAAYGRTKEKVSGTA